MIVAVTAEKLRRSNREHARGDRGRERYVHYNLQSATLGNNLQIKHCALALCSHETFNVLVKVKFCFFCCYICDYCVVLFGS